MKMMRVTGWLVVVCALCSSARAADGDAEELRAQRARWQDAVTGAYRYGYNKYCECHRDEPPETVVTVERGVVTRVYHLHADSDREVPAREGSLDLYWTMEGLFDLVETALASDASVRVRYDGTLGYPVQIYIDYDAAAVGEELDLRLTRVELLD